MMLPDLDEPARAAEVHALARKLEARARRTRDRDLARCAALLRVLLAILTDNEAEADRRCQDTGGLH